MALRRLNRPPQDRVLQRDAPADYTGPEAPERVLHINLWFVKFGTNDKLQGAAILLAIFILLLITVVIFYGMTHTTTEWNEKVFSWLSSTFLIVAGVAIGRASSDKSE